MFLLSPTSKKLNFGSGKSRNCPRCKAASGNFRPLKNHFVPPKKVSLQTALSSRASVTLQKKEKSLPALYWNRQTNVLPKKKKFQMLLCWTCNPLSHFWNDSAWYPHSPPPLFILISNCRFDFLRPPAILWRINTATKYNSPLYFPFNVWTKMQ